MEERLKKLEDIVFNGEFPDKKEFYRPVSAVKGIKLKGGMYIFGGSATSNASIKLDVGTAPAGSLYLSSANNGEIWIMRTTTWTQITVP